jgi:outer membrane protein TolC
MASHRWSPHCFQGCHQPGNETGWLFIFPISTTPTVLSRPLKLILLAVLGVLSAAVHGQTPPPLPATLPEDLLPGLRAILRSAMQQSPQMIARNIDLAAQEANRYQLAAPEWPNLSGGLNYAYNQSAVASNAAASSRSEGFFYNLSLNQPIYHWGALQAATDIAHLQIKISERQYADAYSDLLMTLRSQYLSLIGRKVQLRNARFELGQTKATVAVVEERFKNAAATTDEVTNARLQLDDANLGIDRATEGFAHFKRLFMLTAGLSELDDKTIPDEVPAPIYSADAVEALMQNFEGEGLKDTFQAQIYDYEIKKSELSYKIAKYRLYPKLDLGLGLSEQNQTEVVGQTVSQNPIFSDSVTLSVNWSIFDGFATRGAKLAALAGKRAAERNRQNYLDRALEQARGLERQLGFSARAMAIAERRLQLNEEALRRAQDNFKLHTISQAEMDQATASFYQWQSAAFDARADFLSDWSQYLSLLEVDPVLNDLATRFTNHAK